jgi:hypothetical protein
LADEGGRLVPVVEILDEEGVVAGNGRTAAASQDRDYAQGRRERDVNVYFHYQFLLLYVQEYTLFYRYKSGKQAVFFRCIVAYCFSRIQVFLCIVSQKERLERPAEEAWPEAARLFSAYVGI